MFSSTLLISLFDEHYKRDQTCFLPSPHLNKSVCLLYILVFNFVLENLLPYIVGCELHNDCSGFLCIGLPHYVASVNVHFSCFYSQEFTGSQHSIWSVCSPFVSGMLSILRLFHLLVCSRLSSFIVVSAVATSLFFNFSFRSAISC